MQHIIYGIIVGVAVAAIIIVQLGDLFQPWERTASQQPSAPKYDYDNFEELG